MNAEKSNFSANLREYLSMASRFDSATLMLFSVISPCIAVGVYGEEYSVMRNL